jgi:hypothetical protein
LRVAAGGRQFDRVQHCHQRRHRMVRLVAVPEIIAALFERRGRIAVGAKIGHRMDDRVVRVRMPRDMVLDLAEMQREIVLLLLGQRLVAHHDDAVLQQGPADQRR